MTKLKTLRKQLARLRRARQTARVVTAHAAWLIPLVWATLALFAVDYTFELNSLQRIFMMGVGVFAVGWSFARFSLEHLRVSEDEYDVALMVERQRGIDSDLVAALQFERWQAASWGSIDLQAAVIDSVARFGRGLNVFEGFSREQMMRHGLSLLLSVAVIVGLAAKFPEHARVFAARLMLANEHYPTRTVIDRIAVNNSPALIQTKDGTTPRPTRCPEGRPVSFAVQCSGKRPPDGVVRLTSVATRRRRAVELAALTVEQRKKHLEETIERFRQGQEAEESTGTNHLAPNLPLDAPEAARLLRKSPREPADISAAIEVIKDVLNRWPNTAQQATILVGQLDRMIEPLSYQVFAGDAWTDSALLETIPLPIIELRLVAEPPEYARAWADDGSDVNSRQISVLEGSRVRVSIQCMNKKRLTEAWIAIEGSDGWSRVGLRPSRDDEHRWVLDEADTALAQVNGELRFEIQVTDADGMHPEAPIRGHVRIRADRPPTAAADVVHRVVLPDAQPTIEYRVVDDYGIAKVLLHLQVEKQASATDDQHIQTPTDSPRQRSVLQQTPIAADRLPYFGKTDVNLSQLALQKGDRLQITLEAVDYRGQLEGKSFLTEPLVLEISDEAGVLAAISEADERSEKRLSDIIQQQLGIGESP